MHELASRFFVSQLPGSWVPGYLADRGFGHQVQQQWQIGYAPGTRDALARCLLAFGHSARSIVAAGLARRSQRGLIDVFRDRLMLPIRAPHGGIVAFIGRAGDGRRPDVPKYLNSPSTPIYRKGDVLFGLWEARSALGVGAMPVITEGPFDAIAVATVGDGLYAPVSPCGTALTVRQVQALGRAVDLQATGVLVAFDPDSAGRRAGIRAYHLLVPHTAQVMAATLPAGQDPAQVLRDHGQAAVLTLLNESRHPLADLVIDAEIGKWAAGLDFAEGQIAGLRATVPLIAAMPSHEIARQVARLAERIGLDHPVVTGAVIEVLSDIGRVDRPAPADRSSIVEPSRPLKKRQQRHSPLGPSSGV